MLKGRWLLIFTASIVLIGAGCAAFPFQVPPTSPPVTTLGNECAGPDDTTSCPKGYACTAECGPPVARQDDPPPKWSCWPAGKTRMCPICLASSVKIATPDGPVNVKATRVGMRVWSQDQAGKRIASRVLSVTRTPVPSKHHVIHLLLSDGRETWASPDHPTADGRRLKDLHPGDRYDGAFVRAADLVPYDDDATYDLLPDSQTGTYWADGILLDSTLTSAADSP